MPDPHKAFWGYVHQETPDELLTRNGNLFPLPMILIIFSSKGYGTAGHTFNPIVADSDAMGVFPKIPDHGFSPIERFFTVRDPFFAVAGVYKLFESIMVMILFCSTMKLKLAFFP